MRLGLGFLLAWIFSTSAAPARLAAGLVWERVDARRGHQANDLTVASNAVVVVGNEGAIWRSTDRENWTVEKSGVTNNLLAIAEGNGMLVAVGSAGRILRSSSAGVWTSEQSGTIAGFESIAYGGGFFVAVGTGGTAVYSSDGRRWRPWATGVTKNLHDVAWNGNGFVIVGDTGTALSAPPEGILAPLANNPGTSLNFDRVACGINGSFIGPGFFMAGSAAWTYQGDLNFNDVACGTGVFVGVSDQGSVFSSGDGIQWTQILTSSEEGFRSVKWTGSEFVAVTDSGRLAMSADGSRWRMLGLFRYYSAGCWDGAQYVLVGNGGAVVTTTDGKWWTAEKNPSVNNLTGVTSGGGMLVAIGENSSILSSPDGHSWQQASIPCSWSLTDVHWSGNAFWSVGKDGIILTSVNGSDWTISAPGLMSAAVWDGSRYLAFSGNNVIRSADGNQWTPLAKAPNVFPINDLIWTGTQYIAVGDSSTLLRSADGITWTQATFTGAVSIPSFSSVASSGSELVAMADDYHARSTDGVIWTRYKDEYTGIKDILWDGKRFLAAGLSGIHESNDGIAWQRIYYKDLDQFAAITRNGSKYIAVGDRIGSNAGILCTSSDGVVWSSTVIAGPGFVDVKTVPGGDGVAIGTSGGIMRFRNNAWSSENSSLIGAVKSLVVAPDGVIALSVNSMSARSAQPGVWLPGSQRTTSASLSTITSGNGRIVAGSDESVLVSSNGSDWSDRFLGPYPTIARKRGIWTGSEFAFVMSRSVWTSSTGEDWTELGSATNCERLYDIAYFKGNLILAGVPSPLSGSGIWNVVNGAIQPGTASSKYITTVVSGGPRVLGIGSSPISTSDDGLVWMPGEPDPALSSTLKDVIHTPMGFFAIGGGLFQSADGRNWNKVRTNIGSLPTAAMVYGGNRIVTVGNGLASSTDGVSWSYLASSSGFGGVAWGNGRFVAVSNNRTASSGDGVTWQMADQVFALEAVVWTGSEFMGTNTNGAVLVSDDGLAWRYRVMPGSITGYAYGNGIHVASTSSGEVFKSEDSVNWTRVLKVGAGSTRVAFANNLFFVPGLQTYRSGDAVTWTLLSRSYQDVIWTGTQYVGVGSGGLIGLSSNATTWTQKATPTTQTLRAAVWTGDRIAAVGDGGAAVSSVDGNVWTSLDFAINTGLTDVAWTGSDLLALAANGSIAHLKPLPAPPSDFIATSLFSDGNVTLAADAAGRVATLEGTRWQESVRQTRSPLNVISNTASGLLACGASGVVLRSDDGSTWSSQSGWNHAIGGARANEVFQVRNVIDGRMVGLGTRGSVVDSTDGRNWQLRTPGLVGDLVPLNSCVQVDGDIVSVGNTGRILRTKAATARYLTSRTAQNLLAVAGGDDRLVAVGGGGVILYSGPDTGLPDCFERWIDREGASVSSSAASDDPNQDGVANLLAYLSGIPAVGSTSQGDRSHLPQCRSSALGVEVSFEIIPDRDDLELIFERTTDLKVWSEFARKSGSGSWGGAATTVEEPGTNGRKKFTVIDPATDATSAFYRIRPIFR